MTLYFVRHGETDYNRHHQLMGQRIDASLDDTGRQQAHHVIAKLPKDFTVIYSSPLKRAAETAKIIADYFNKNVEISNDLKERDFGKLSGMNWHEVDIFAGEPLSVSDENLTYDYTKFHGESVAQVKGRLQNFIHEVKKKHPNENIVVVTHYGIINLMNSLYPHKEHHKLTNSSVHKFEI